MVTKIYTYNNYEGPKLSVVECLATALTFSARTIYQQKLEYMPVKMQETNFDLVQNLRRNRQIYVVGNDYFCPDTYFKYCQFYVK